MTARLCSIECRAVWTIKLKLPQGQRSLVSVAATSPGIGKRRPETKILLRLVGLRSTGVGIDGAMKSGSSMKDRECSIHETSISIEERRYCRSHTPELEGDQAETGSGKRSGGILFWFNERLDNVQDEEMVGNVIRTFVHERVKL